MNIFVNDIHSEPDCSCQPQSEQQGGYFAHVIGYDEPSLLDSCFRLRHTYFVRHRRWVPCDGSGLESDHYDPLAHHLAVFRDSHLAAYLRLLPWQKETGFMLEHEFSCLISQEEKASLIHENSAEISRLVIASAVRPQAQQTRNCQPHPNNAPQPVTGQGRVVPSTPDVITPSAEQLLPPQIEHRQNGTFKPHVMEVLLKLLYHVSLQHHITTYYLVVETTWLKTFTRRFGIPFTPIGTPYTFPDGTTTQAAFTTLEAIEHAIATNHPHKYQWYRQLP